MEKQKQQQPTLGRTVLYTLTAANAAHINRRRTDSQSIRARLDSPHPSWPIGAQAHIGNPAEEGQVFPMEVVKVNSLDAAEEEKVTVNGQVKLDGSDVLWVTDIQLNEGAGNTPGFFAWPART